MTGRRPHQASPEDYAELVQLLDELDQEDSDPASESSPDPPVEIVVGPPQPVLDEPAPGTWSLRCSRTPPLMGTYQSYIGGT